MGLVRRKVYAVDPDRGRLLLKDQSHEINNRDRKCSHLNPNRVACGCQNFGDYEVPIDWVWSVENKCTRWGITPDDHIRIAEDTESNTMQGDIFGTKLTDPL